MNLLKNKLALFSPIIVLVVVIIFGLTITPTLNPIPKNVPIAIVNEDMGVDVPNQGKLNMGKTISEKIKEMANPIPEKEPVVKWISVSSYEKVKKGLDNKDYYAAFIIPKDFSLKQASLRTLYPATPEVKIMINQGMNTMGATMAGQVLNGVVDNLTNNIRTEIVAGFEKQGQPLTTKQAATLVTPIAKKVTNVNEIGTQSANGNAPISLIQPLWIGCIAGAVILFLMMNKLVFADRKEKFMNLWIQICTGAVIALFAGFGLTWIADTLGMNIQKFTDTALFLAIAYFSFFLMITAVLSWLGIKGIGIFVIILFFGAPLLAMAPEFMSPFYRDWIYSWLPMRFMVEGIRELFYFGKGLSFNHATSVLLWIGTISLIVILASGLKSCSMITVKSKKYNM
jgi:YhgE/Pip-like protein